MNEDISRIVNNGGNVSHILSIHIEAEDDSVKDAVSNYIYDVIHNKPIKKMYRNQIIEVAWETFDKKNYYTNSLLFNDIGINLHTNILMKDLSIFAKNKMIEINDSVFSITYHITKPLSKNVILL